MAKYEKKGQEPERLPAADEIEVGTKTHAGLIPLVAPPGVTSVAGCVLEGRLCWAPPDIVDQLISIHHFERPSG